MKQHLHSLEPYKGPRTRHTCPQCHRRTVFVKYINTQTGEHVNPAVGRCNRESRCGYHYTPKQYFTDNNIALPVNNKYMQPIPIARKKAPTHIPVELVKASHQAGQPNHFITYLTTLFGPEVTAQAVSNYFIGSSTHWDGATVFWQLDKAGNARSGKIMLYNPTTGKRVKEPFNHINWVHTVIPQPDFELCQCFFGEHLLRDTTKPIAIVESEKTAIIASVYFPDWLWLATGSLSNLNADKCRVLKGRSVTFFPDLNAYDKWKQKAEELDIALTISDLLERKAGATERQQSFDLADYLVQEQPMEQPVRFIDSQTSKPDRFNELSNEKQTQWNTALTKLENRFGCTRGEFFTPAETLPTPQDEFTRQWINEALELEVFFAAVTLPTYPVKVNACTTITDMAKFLESHFSCVKQHAGNKRFLVFMERLRELKGWVLERG